MKDKIMNGCAVVFFAMVFLTICTVEKSFSTALGCMGIALVALVVLQVLDHEG